MSIGSVSDAIDIYMKRRISSSNDNLKSDSINVEELRDQLEKTRNELKTVKELTISRPEMPIHKFNRDEMFSLLQNFDRELDSLVKTIKALAIFESKEAFGTINEEALKQTLNLVNSLDLIGTD